VDWRVEREPFGSRYAVRAGASRLQPLAFPGQEEDTSTDRSYNIHRWYRAGWSRYTQADPIGVVRPSEIANLYQYADGDPIGIYDPSGLDAVTDDPQIQKCTYCIFTKAGSGWYNSEEAFWIICDPTNGYNCEMWPSTKRQGTSSDSTTTFKNKVPDHACGIMHTHPLLKPAKPSTCSGCDVDQAIKIGMPIYTAHPTGIWKYDPKTKQTTREADSQWPNGPKRACGKGDPCAGL
jgi:RHS repeat-associated protein